MDDSKAEQNTAAVRSVWRRWRRAGVPIHLLRNRRTPGAAGAWNSGLDHLARHVADPDKVYVAFLDDDATAEAWISEWASAFDVDRVTKRFYTDYQDLHDQFHDDLQGVKGETNRKWLASVVLNRLMFVYFLQKKGFLADGNLPYLEDKLPDSKADGKDRFYRDFLALLFFEGFAKPESARSMAARATLGDIAYLNGGLFLPHPLEQAADAAGETIDLPDSAFDQAFELFASFSWNLNDMPGGQDNEINPDVLGYILEKYTNQKALGAYSPRPPIPNHPCQRPYHRPLLPRLARTVTRPHRCRRPSWLVRPLPSRPCSRIWP